MSRTFGKYELLAPIAHGGMAEVFKATAQGSAGFERIVAIKCILPHLSEDASFVSMFVDEAKIAVQLSHSNIAQIFDLGCIDGRYYIALEYVHGRDLRAIAHREDQRGGSVPIPVACHVVMKVAGALAYAHRAEGRDGRPLDVIHRDVSPQNILVSFDGGVKVVDFGLAKAAGRVTQTQAGVLKGKLAYLSPEQAQSKPIDYRSDVYALGICFHELLTGQRLFLRDTDMQTILAIREGVVPRASDLASDVPATLDAIVHRALEPDPEARYQSAMELHDDLEAFSYQTGSPFGRRQLTEYMRHLFPEETMSAEELPELDEADLVLEESRIVPERTTTGEIAVEQAMPWRASSPDVPARDSTKVARLRPRRLQEPERLPEPETLGIVEPEAAPLEPDPDTDDGYDPFLATTAERSPDGSLLHTMRTAPESDGATSIAAPDAPLRTTVETMVEDATATHEIVVPPEDPTEGEEQAADAQAADSDSPAPRRDTIPIPPPEVDRDATAPASGSLEDLLALHTPTEAHKPIDDTDPDEDEDDKTLIV